MINQLCSIPQVAFLRVSVTEKFVVWVSCGLVNEPFAGLECNTILTDQPVFGPMCVYINEVINIQ